MEIILASILSISHGPASPYLGYTPTGSRAEGLGSFIFIFFSDTVSMYIPDWPGTLQSQHARYCAHSLVSPCLAIS